LGRFPFGEEFLIFQLGKPSVLPPRTLLLKLWRGRFDVSPKIGA
jgi:hypothetical protein